MEETMDALSTLFRWMHIFDGILWIGMLYFFNFVNGPFAATMDGETKKKVVPELMPRALFWFRWGAFWTWSTGVLLLALVFWHGGSLMFNIESGWSASSIAMVAAVFLAPFAYDAMAKSALVKNKKAFVLVGFGVIAVVIFLMCRWAGFTYRAYNIHMGAMFGSIMAFNVWFRIWPGQQKILTAIKGGEAPNADIVAMAGLRSRHNTYLSVPLVWTMINAHTTGFSGGNFGLSETNAWLAFLVVVALGWHIVWHCYKKAGTVKGW